MQRPEDTTRARSARWLRLLAGALALTMVLGACGDDDDEDERDPDTSTEADGDGGADGDEGALSSSFDDDAHGWTTNADAMDLTLETEGGNPGGFLQAEDSPSGATWYWVSPAAWAGDRSDVAGGSLRFDQIQSSTDNPYDDVDVVLVGNDGTALTFVHGQPPGTEWTSYALSLTDDGWYDEFFAPAADGAVAEVLGDLASIQIRGEFKEFADTGGLDNVVLSPEPPTDDERTPGLDPIGDVGLDAPEPGTDDDATGDDDRDDRADADDDGDIARPEADAVVELVPEQVASGGPVGTFDHFGSVGVTLVDGGDGVEFLADIGVPTDDRIIEVGLYRGDPGIDGPSVALFSGPLTVGQNNVATYFLDGAGMDDAIMADVVAEPAAFYIEVVTEQWPTGALRGQLG